MLTLIGRLIDFKIMLELLFMRNNMKNKATFFILNGLVLTAETVFNYFIVLLLFVVGIMKYYDYELFLEDDFGYVFFISICFYAFVSSIVIAAIQKFTKTTLKQNILLFLFSFALAIGVVVVKYNNNSLEYVAFTEGLQQFDEQYMSSNYLYQAEIDRIHQHPDYIEFMAYKNNPLLTSSVRREYYKKLEESSKQLNLLKSNKKTYDLSYLPNYFVRTTVSDNFLINYSNIQDPELQTMMLNMFKYSVIRTSDYIKFHELYKTKFISSSSTLNQLLNAKGDSNE